MTAPEPIRDELRQLPAGQLIRRCSRFRRSNSRTPDELAIVLTLRSLARRIEAATEEANELEREIIGHVRTLVPELLNEPGVGPIVAAQLIISWSHRDRVRSEAAFARLAGVAPLPASSGQTIRHRLSAAATANSTVPCTPSSCTAANTTQQQGTTSPAASPKAKALATQPGYSSATSPATSTAPCRTRAPR